MHRRWYLQSIGAATITAGAVTALAGCAEPGEQPAGALGDYDEEAVDAARAATGLEELEPPAYRRWIPAGDGERREYGLEQELWLSLSVPKLLTADHSSLVPWAAAGWAGGPWFGVELAALERICWRTGPVAHYVFEGDFSPSTAIEALEDAAYERRRSLERELFDDNSWFLLAEPSTSRLVAVGSGVVITDDVQRGDDDPAGDAARRLARTVRTGSGALERAHEADEAFASVTESVGQGMLTASGTVGIDPSGADYGPFTTHAVHSVDVIDSTTLGVRGAYVLEGDDEDVESALEQNNPWLAAVQTDDTITAARDGLTVDGFQEIDGEPPADESVPNPPRFTLGFQADPATDTITLHHLGGDTIEAADFSVDLDSETLKQVDEDFSPGHTLEVSIDGERTRAGQDRLQLVWQRERPLVLADSRVRDLLPPDLELSVEDDARGIEVSTEDEWVDQGNLDLTDGRGTSLSFEYDVHGGDGLDDLIDITSDLSNRSTVVLSWWPARGLEPIELERFDANDLT